MTSATANVWAVVPAAGAGRRFREAGNSARGTGGNKLLEPVHGRPMLVTVIDALEASRVAGVVVVVSPVIEKRIKHQRPPTDTRRYVVNDREGSEMIVSVQLGLQGVAGQLARQRVDAVLADDVGYLVCPGDHPGVTTAAADRCVEAFRQDTSRLVIATCRGRRGHPIILPADLARQVLAWSESERLDTLRARYPSRVREVETQEPGVLIDVDRPEDLERLGGRV